MFRIFSQYVSRKAFLHFVADAVLGCLALALAAKLRALDSPEVYATLTEWPDFGYRVAAVVGSFLVCSYYNDLYTQDTITSFGEQFFRMVQALGVACFGLAAVYYAVPDLRLGRGAFGLGILLILVFSSSFRWVTDRFWHGAVTRMNVAIVGVQSLAQTTASEIGHRADLNMRVVGFVGVGSPGEAALGPDVLGGADKLEQIVQTYAVEKLIVALEENEPSPTPYLLRARTRGVVIEDARAMLAALTGRVAIETVPSSWFIFSEGFRRSRYALAFKRLLDLALGLIGLAISLPIMAIVGLCVRLDSAGPILFRQRRVGYEGQCFELMKFRTMRVDAEADGVARWAEKNDPRVTRIGGFLRKYRFDELPQFVNVIRGDMSLVGPRPERPEFVERLRAEIPFYDERHTLRPGITGWAQICYPYGATVEDALRKLEYDLFYLKNVSILFDMAIVLQTVKIILWGRGQ
ncbi:MAG: TIGR03013 family PEP-CTERM/XrtA system glycosyltransferase [Acidobacteria bacterium]|nr:TIGR03013 family PEP-CTERM/XrtA system glycosyltransferase [Acidobacteriota bacterium]